MRGIIIVLLLGLGMVGLLCQAYKIQLEQTERWVERLRERANWSTFGKPYYIEIPAFSAERTNSIEPDLGVSEDHSRYV